MPKPRYLWRQLTKEQQQELLEHRQSRRNPWHSPPHRSARFGLSTFHLMAACYEHNAYIGLSPERMDDFSRALVNLLADHAEQNYAWAVLPNHYHALVEAPDVRTLLQALGKLHGRTSHQWNGEEQTRGRKVFYRALEREMRTERHFFATLNYVHHQPVHHGYTTRWQDWRWGSAAEYLEQEDPKEVQRLWKSYPLDKYGQGWDDPTL